MSSKAQTRDKDYERGLRIADRRKELGFSQDELAHRIGIGRQALSAIENGGDFKVSVLEKMVKMLSCSSDELIFVTESNNKNLLENILIELKKMDECEINKWLHMIRAVNDIKSYE